MADVDEILATLEACERAYCARDGEGLMALFDEDAAISLIGTGEDVPYQNRKKILALFKRNFKTANARRFEWHWRHVTVSGNAAVVASSLTIHPQDTSGSVPQPERWTVALVRRGSGWKWLHRHASIAAPGQGDGAADPR